MKNLHTFLDNLVKNNVAAKGKAADTLSQFQAAASQSRRCGDLAKQIRGVRLPIHLPETHLETAMVEMAIMMGGNNGRDVAGVSRLIQGNGFSIKESKFDYFFGRVTSSPHNQARSLQNQQDLTKLGIDEAAGGRERLMQIFEDGLSSPEVRRSTNDYGTTIVRTVEVSGAEASGAIEISYFYPGSNLSAPPEISSIIPKIYPKESK